MDLELTRSKDPKKTSLLSQEIARRINDYLKTLPEK